MIKAANVPTILLTLIFCIICIPINSSSKETKPAEYTNKDKMLIVITAPPSGDKYYKNVYDKIIRYDIEYTKKVIGKDNIIVLGDKKALSILKKELPENILLEANMRDIWMRDFSTVNPYNPVQFRYAAAAQGGSQHDADWVQKGFNNFTAKLGIKYPKTKYILDGGNLVDNYKDKAIVTERFLEDNDISYDQGKEILKKILDVKFVAIVPSDDEEGLAHADGMVMFINDNTVAVNKYTGDFRLSLISELRESFPKIKIVELETEYDNKIWDENFSSSCGIYTNSIVTENHIYMPIFGSDLDQKAIEKVQKNTKKKVIPINASSVCFMGGSVRCLGWQVTGKNAEKLIDAAKNNLI